MRIDVKKYLFLGPQKNKDLFFEEAQKIGMIDFVAKKGTKASHFSSALMEIVQAIRVLRGLNPSVQYDAVPVEKVKEVVSLINEAHQKLEAAIAEKSALKEKLELIAPYGSFSVNKVRRFEKESGLLFDFFAIKRTAPLEIPPDIQLFKAGMSEDLDFYFSLGKRKFVSPKILEIVVNESKDDLHEDLEENEEKIREIEKTLKECSHYNKAVHHFFLEQLNIDNLTIAVEKAESLLGENVFVVAGWVPVNKIEMAAKFCESENVVFHEIRSDPNELVPTYLENQGFHQVGEDLVHIYDTPANNDKDPSLWVLIFFSIFFAIIVNDAGYGALYLILFGYLWWRNPKVQGFKRRVLTLCTTLSVACVIWGILAASYFGVPMTPQNPLKKYSLMQYLIYEKAAYHLRLKDEVWRYWVGKFPQLKGVSNPVDFVDKAVEVTSSGNIYPIIDRFADNILFEIALLIGVVHLILSMARYCLRHWSLIGWMIFMVGAYFWVSAAFDYTSIINFAFGIPKDIALIAGKQMTIGGIILAVVLALIQERLYGIMEIMRVISILADTLSYLRIYALGMAGGILAATINSFVVSFPWIVGILIALVGHSFNMSVGIMSGVIHGLRLNFLEWYHYSFYGGGKQFKPLRILTKDD